MALFKGSDKFYGNSTLINRLSVPDPCLRVASIAPVWYTSTKVDIVFFKLEDCPLICPF